MYFKESVAAVVCVIVTLTQAQSPTVSCSNPPPGMAKMIRGVDITSLDLVPLEITSDRGFRSPVLEYTCNNNRSWRNPQGLLFQLPDTVWHMTTVPGGWLSADVRLFKSGEDVRRWMNGNVGAEGTISKFSFSGSYSYNKMQHTIHNTSKFVQDVSAFESATRIDLIPQWVLQLDYFAQMYLDHMISGTFETNRAAYNSFIAEFGTHYFSTGNFGGYIRTYQETNKDYIYSKSDNEVKTNAKASFMSIISAHGGTVSGSTSVSETFRRSTTIDTKYYGGDTNLLQSDGIQTWQPTVDADPWLFSGQLKPIYELIRNATVKESMRKAVYEYVMRIFLEELGRVLAAARARVPNDNILNALQNRLNAMTSLDTLVEGDVESLRNDIYGQVVIPSWFTDRTKLCYQWRPDGDGGQCGGGASRRLCASPNSMTPVYRDDTDRRGGGCRMQWAITSSNFPSWFRQVQVCYRWHPDGDGGQCGGGASRLLCSNINSYTNEYRDDTDRRAGGCQMSWRIVVPATAPAWLKTVKLCYNWYPDGDGGQCAGPSRSLCAVANAWTAYYRDDTDGRAGGCRMSWGLKAGI